MLAALLLLGLLPIAALPVLKEDNIDDDATPSPKPGVQPAPTTEAESSILDEIAPTVAPQSVDPSAVNPTAETATSKTTTGPQVLPEPVPETQPEVYSMDATPGETVIDSFAPGVDVIELYLDDTQGELSFDINTTANGASVSFTSGAEPSTTLTFAGLTEVPAEDILLGLLDETTGDPFEVTLQEVIDAADAEAQQPLSPVVPEPTLQPLDPAMPETLDPAESPDPLADPAFEPILDPIAPLEPLDPEAENPVAGGSLSLGKFLSRDSENLSGSGATLNGAQQSGVAETELSPSDDVISLADDGLDETGQGTVSLGAATPVVLSPDGIATVDGGAGDDQITTGDGAAFAFGGDGNDTLTAGEGAAALYGGAGEDLLSAEGSSNGQYLDGGVGDDALSGSAGNDTLEGGEHSAAQSAGDDTLNGGAGDDLIRGGYGADMLVGGAGDDVIDHLGRTEERSSITQHEFAWHTDGAADTLSGGEGNDTLILDRFDVASGGTGNDVFWLWHDGAEGGGVAEVTDFVVGEDFLRVSLNPHATQAEETDIQVTPSEDGFDGMVTINGDLIAILRGAPTATSSDIYAEVRPDVFQ